MKTTLPLRQKYLFSILTLFVASCTFAQTTESFTTPGSSTWTPPNGVNTMTVRAWGAGGKGGDRISTFVSAGGGGGAVAQRINLLVSSTTYTISVGAGGSGATLNGGNTSFYNNTLGTTEALARGGNGVVTNSTAAGTGGSAGSSIGDALFTFSGGNGGAAGANNTNGYSGGGGSSAGTGANGANGGTPAGGNAPIGGGDGGDGFGVNNGNGVAGANPGGGGGGAFRQSGSTRTGGDGGDGQLTITYTCPTYTISSTTTNSPLCSTSPAATVTLQTGTMVPGTYTVTYNLTGATSATGLTASVTIALGLPNSGSFVTVPLSNGVTNVRVTGITSRTCTSTISTNNTATVVVDPAPTANAGTAITTCATTTSLNITAGASATNPNGIMWSTNGSGTFSGPNSLTGAVYTPSAADRSAGTITLTLTVNGLGSCAPAVSTKTLTITPMPTVNAGSNIITCTSTSSINVTNGASASNTSAVNWTSSGTGTFANGSSLTLATYAPSAADISSGSVTLTLTGTAVSPCSGTDVATKTLTFGPNPSANAGTAVSTCAGSGAVNITTGANASNYQTVLWTSSGTGTFTSANSISAATYTPSAADIAAGSVTLTLTASRTSCTSGASTKTLTIVAQPTANAGGTLNMCTSAGSINVTTGASATNSASVVWSSSGTGTMVNANSMTTASYTPSAADVSAGSVTITLTVTGNSPCGTATSTRTINIFQAPTAVAGTPIAICASTTGAVSITSGASASNYTTLAWTSSGTGTFANANSVTTATYNASAADRSAGSVTLTLTATNAGCGSVTSTKTFTISPVATSVAGANMNACYGVTPIDITPGSSASNYTTLAWTSSGSGTFANANSTTLATYSPSAADLSAGSVTLTLTATGIAPCSNAVSTKTLNLFQAPVADAGTAVSTCNSSGAINVTAGATATFATSVLWTSSGTGTFTNANSLTNATYNPSAADISAGSVVLTLTATNTGCGTDTSTKTLTIYANPTVTSTVPATRVGAGTLILGASASVGTLYWYAAATGGSSLGFGSSFTTPYITATTTYYVEAVNGPCISSPRTPVTATVIYPEINITGNGNNILDGALVATATDFTDFGTTNMTRTFTIQNTGVGSLSLGAITFSGANASEFTVTTAPATTVATGSSTTFTVTFNPTAVGIRTARISIVNNDSDENPYDFALQGTGVAREIDIQGNATTIVDGDTTPTTADWTDFSTVTATRTFTIRNLGNIALNIGAITLTGLNASDFAVTTAPAATVGAYGTTTFTVTFTPTAINNRIATLNIANNDSDENPYDFAIQGFGVIPEIDIRGNATSIADNDLTPSTADWTDFGSTTVTRTFTIYNQGNTNLTIGAITFNGTNPTEFTVTTPPTSPVPAFGTTTFTVTFAPTATGTRSAVMHIVNNDSNENPYDFALQGTGVDREIDILGNAVSIVNNDSTPTTADWTDFSNVTLTRTFTINNLGNLPLTLGAVTFVGGNSTEFALTTAPTSPVPAFGSTTFTITFNPAATGVRTTQFRIVNNDGDENPYRFTIQGTGGTPEINIKSQYGVSIADGDTTPDPADRTNFGEVSMDGGSVVVNFVIENTGTGPLTIGAATFSGANVENFSVTQLPAATIAPGTNSRFKITFAPTTVGNKYASFSLVTNDSDENPYNFDLTGTGVQTYKDTDGDGVTDNKDLDDDNDGIIDLKEQTDGLSFPLTSLVQYVFLNETFGAGRTKGQININTPGATCSYCYEDGYGSACDASVTLEDGEYVVTHKITGSVGSDPENIHGDLAWYDGLDHTPSDTDGRMAVFNASFAAGTFYETRIDGVIPNVPISYSFYVLNIMRKSNFVGSIKPNITVEFVDLNNNLLSSFNTGFIGRCTTADSNDNTCNQSTWLPFSVSVNLGNVTSFIIRFKNNSTGGGGNDLAIDDIRIVQDYIDTDGDGIANIFDLDDENDGIPDIEEAGFKAYSSGLSRMDMSSAATWVDANHNGLHDAIDAQIAGSTYLIADTDGDGVPNYLDLDSDNDSLFDVDESNTLNGDGDINGDGRGDLVDTDRDGILDLYDLSNSTFGTNARAFAQDTDGDGTPDYLDLDSNNDGINDIQTYLYGSLDANNDGRIDGTADIDKDGILDSFDTNTSVTGSPRDLNRKLYLEFDGRNDYGQGTTVLGSRTAAAMMAWIDLGTGYSADGAVVGQDKFYLRVNAARQLQLVINSTVYTYASATLATNRWYHVGATLSSSAIKLYLNGVPQTFAAVGAIGTDTNPLTIGRLSSAASTYFKGKIDEVRIFSAAINDQQFQRIVYQEMENNLSQVRGAIVQRTVGSLPWGSVLRYYRMDAYKDDIVDDLTTASIDVSTGMRIYNNKYIRVQEAPMPFETERTGDFATAVNSPTKDIRGLDIMDQDWSIVRVHHNITETSNNVDIGMFVDSGVTVTMNNDTKIQNDWYLKLDGKIDLQGKSQLVQTTQGELDVTSAGSIERDQQGQSNLYNYNYWCSPVGSLSTVTNNVNHTVNGVMRDGTNPANPQNINWVTGYNGAPTSPISIASYWIFKFQNTTPVYANWSSVGPNGTLMVGQGFTMKGSGAATATQNLTFVGKPNNANITSPIAANNLNLSGNPYPSAIDANAFITANTAATTGTLYFWEHYGTNNTHVLANYQGGYATRNLVGGTPPVAPAGVSGQGSSTRVPGRFIPVGQGFFVSGSSTGGSITFTNAQRTFIKEDNAASNYMFKLEQNVAGPRVQSEGNNAEDTYEEDTFARIRLGFTSPEQFHRQTLMGFMDEFATSSIEPGYDAPHIDNQPSDMYFLNGTTKLNIEGEGYFNEEARYPIGIKLAAAGTVKLMIDGTENFDDSQEMYIYDQTTDEYHSIKDEMFQVDLAAGVTDNRFFLTFKSNEALANETFDASVQIEASYTSEDRMITVNNPKMAAHVETITLFNMLGQPVQAWDVSHMQQNRIQVPVKGLSTAAYIIKVTTDQGDLSKKVIIK